jgi:hypothetical protein
MQNQKDKNYKRGRLTMKRRLLACTIILCGAIVLVGYKCIVYGDIFGDFLQKVGTGIYSSYDDAVNTLKRIPACADVVSKGIEWSAMQATYYTAQGTLEVAKTLQQADPRLAALQAKITASQAAITGLEATMAAGSAGVDITAAAGRWGVQTLADLGNIVGLLLTRGINIQHAEFSMNLAEAKVGKLPMVNLGGIFAGKQVDLNLQINFKDIPATLINLSNALKTIVG